MNNSKYSIVEFSNGEGVALVSKTWIFSSNETTQSYWPPFRSSALCNRAAEKCQPHELSWKSYECRILYSTDDYAKARLKLHDAEMTSNLESEMEVSDAQNLKRKRSQRQRYVESSASGSDVEQPPRKRHETVPKTISPRLTVPTPPQSLQPISQLPQSEAEITPRSVGSGRNSAFERHILTLIQEVKDSVVEMRKDIAILMATQQTQKTRGEISAPEEMPEDISFPLNTTEEVAALEAKLIEDADLKQLIIRNISSIGGTSVSDCTRRILRQMFSNNCAKHLNWKGRGGKMALSGMALSAVIIRAVRMNPLTSNASHAEIETNMKDWLKFASERDGGRKKRAEKQRQAEPAHDDSAN